MDFRFIVLIFGILFVICHAQQSASGYQSVGGDFGKTWLANFLDLNPGLQPKDENSTALWGWGGAPKGSVIQNGLLVTDPYYIWKSLNYTSGWLGQAYVDPITGYPVYAYVDPYTGYPVYFYVDPKTGRPVYINAGATAGTPAYNYLPYVGMPNSSNYPWLGDASGLPPAYGGMGMS